MNIDVDKIGQELAARGVDLGIRLAGAIALWILGGWLIGIATRLITAAMDQRKMEPTVAKYVVSGLQVLLKVVLVVALLGYFGIETSSFAAVLAAAGIAIGTAWSGLLAHYAAGVFMVVLRPFKAGDFVSAGGVVGTVESIGLFVTTINTMDNVKTIVGNNKVFSETIQNFSANPTRRVELLAQLDHTADHRKAIADLTARLQQIKHVAASPAPEVNIVTFTLAGPVLAVRPYVHNDHYWDVYFETNMVIREAGFAVPEQHFAVATSARGPAAK